MYFGKIINLLSCLISYVSFRSHLLISTNKNIHVCEINMKGSKYWILNSLQFIPPPYVRLVTIDQELFTVKNFLPLA